MNEAYKIDLEKFKEQEFMKPFICPDCQVELLWSEFVGWGEYPSWGEMKELRPNQPAIGYRCRNCATLSFCLTSPLIVDSVIHTIEAKEIFLEREKIQRKELVFLFHYL